MEYFFSNNGEPFYIDNKRKKQPELIELVLATFRPKFLELLVSTMEINIDNFCISAKDEDNTYNIFSCKSLAEQLKSKYFPKNIDQLFRSDFLQSVLGYLQTTDLSSLNTIKEYFTAKVSKCPIRFQSDDEIRKLIELPDDKRDDEYTQHLPYNQNLNLSELANIICSKKDTNPYYEIYFCYLVCGVITALTTRKIIIPNTFDKPVSTFTTFNTSTGSDLKTSSTPSSPVYHNWTPSRRWQPTHPPIPEGTAAEVAGQYPEQFVINPHDGGNFTL